MATMLTTRDKARLREALLRHLQTYGATTSSTVELVAAAVDSIDHSYEMVEHTPYDDQMARLIAFQGWNDATVRQLALSHVLMLDPKGFLRALREQAREENLASRELNGG